MLYPKKTRNKNENKSWTVSVNKKKNSELFVCLFYFFIPHEIPHSLGYFFITGEGLQIFTYTPLLWSERVIVSHLL